MTRICPSSIFSLILSPNISSHKTITPTQALARLISTASNYCQKNLWMCSSFDKNQTTARHSCIFICARKSIFRSNDVRVFIQMALYRSTVCLSSKQKKNHFICAENIFMHFGPDQMLMTYQNQIKWNQKTLSTKAMEVCESISLKQSTL